MLTHHSGIRRSGISGLRRKSFGKRKARRRVILRKYTRRREKDFALPLSVQRKFQAMVPRNAVFMYSSCITKLEYWLSSANRTCLWNMGNQVTFS